jgi:hypothetical protein
VASDLSAEEKALEILWGGFGPVWTTLPYVILAVAVCLKQSSNQAVVLALVSIFLKQTSHFLKLQHDSGC